MERGSALDLRNLTYGKKEPTTFIWVNKGPKLFRI